MAKRELKLKKGFAIDSTTSVLPSLASLAIQTLASGARVRSLYSTCSVVPSLVPRPHWGRDYVVPWPHSRMRFFIWRRSTLFELSQFSKRTFDLLRMRKLDDPGCRTEVDVVV